MRDVADGRRVALVTVLLVVGRGPVMTLGDLRARGFDASRKTDGGRALVVRCSQCAAAVLCGVPCHETGCPNASHECRGCDARVPMRVRFCADCQGW